VSVVFYQKSNHQEILSWLKSMLKVGYVRHRNDGMTEYTIVGLKEVKEVLTLLYPFLRLKKVLAQEVLKLIQNYPEKIVIAGGPHIKHYLGDIIDAKEPYDFLVPLDGERALTQILKGETENLNHTYVRTGRGKDRK